MTLDSNLAAKGASVPSVLCDLHLLDLLSERSTVSRFELSKQAELCRSDSMHSELSWEREELIEISL